MFINLDRGNNTVHLIYQRRQAIQEGATVNTRTRKYYSLRLFSACCLCKTLCLIKAYNNAQMQGYIRKKNKAISLLISIIIKGVFRTIFICFYLEIPFPSRILILYKFI